MVVPGRKFSGFNSKRKNKEGLRNTLRPKDSAHTHSPNWAFPEDSNCWQDRPPQAAEDHGNICRALGIYATCPVTNPRADTSVQNVKEAGSQFYSG